jgi:hypothetical protein
VFALSLTTFDDVIPTLLRAQRGGGGGISLRPVNVNCAKDISRGLYCQSEIPCFARNDGFEGCFPLFCNWSGFEQSLIGKRVTGCE